MELTGAELIVRFLETRYSGEHGVAAVAVVAGGANLRPLERALARSELRQARGTEAEVLLFGYGTGLAAAAPVLAEAKAQRRPLVAVAAQVRRSLIGGVDCRPEDTRRALDPLSKRWFHVNAAAELVQLLPEAFQLANSARPGPVLLEIPEDVLTEMIQGAWIPQCSRPRRVLPALCAEPMLA